MTLEIVTETLNPLRVSIFSHHFVQEVTFGRFLIPIKQLTDQNLTIFVVVPLQEVKYNLLVFGNVVNRRIPRSNLSNQKIAKDSRYNFARLELEQVQVSNQVFLRFFWSIKKVEGTEITELISVIS